MKKKQISNSKDKSYKKTREELQGLPFETVREKKKAEDDIHLANWKRLTSYKSFQDLISRDEFDSLQKELSTGFICKYDVSKKNESCENSILRVYKAPIGIEVLITQKKPSTSEQIATLAKGLTESFGNLYYNISGLLQEPMLKDNLNSDVDK